MKKLSSFLLVCVAVFGLQARVFAQGAVNIDNVAISPAVDLDFNANYYTGPFTLQVWYLNGTNVPSGVNGAAPAVAYSNLVAAGFSPIQTYMGDADDGNIYFGILDITNVVPAGANVTLALVGWNNTNSADWNAATSANAKGGIVVFVNPTTDYTEVPPIPPVDLTGWEDLGQDLIMTQLGSGQAPVITTQPASQAATVGNDVTFTVNVTGSTPLSYQWYYDTNEVVSNGTNAVLTLTDVQAGQAGVYSVVVSNVAGTAVSSNAVLAVTVPACDAPPVGLVGWWQAEGNYNDTMGNNTAMTTTATFGPGKVGQAFVLNGLGERVEMTEGSTNEQLGDNLTIELWIKRADASYVTSNGVYNYQNAQMVTHGWGVYGFEIAGVPQNGIVTTNGVISLTRPGNNGVESTKLFVTDTNWHHVAVTRAGTNVWFYVDGVGDQEYYAGGTTPFVFINDNQHNFTIGAHSSSGDSAFHGSIDEVGVYNRVLSSNEIVGIYLAGSAGKCPPPAVIVSQPANESVNVGGTASFSVGATGAALSYQWYYDSGTLLTNATNATLTLTGVQPSAAGTYSVVVSNLTSSVTSSNATLTVTPAVMPVITSQPQGQTVIQAGTATFSVGVTGSTPLSYQWYYDTNEVVSNGTNAVLTLTDVQAGQAGVYSVVVSNVAGTAVSSNAVLAVTVPACDAPPVGLVGWWQAEGNYNDTMGNNTAMTTTATFGPGKVGQAFVLNGLGERVEMTEGSTNEQLGDNLTIELWIKRADASYVTSNGVYNYQNAQMVTHGWGVYGFEIAGVPQNGIVTTNGVISLTRPGNNGVESTKLFVTDTNWHHVAVTRAGTNVWFYVDGVGDQEYYAGGTTPFVFINDNQHNFTIGAHSSSGDSAFHGSIDEVGVYNRVLSSNEIVGIYLAGSAGKCPPPAVIVSQPANESVNVGGTASFSVGATGAALSYQWYYDSGTLLTNATNATLTLTGVQPSAAGTYSVVVSNLTSSVTSSNAILTLNVPPGITSQPMGQAVVQGGPVTFNVAATGTQPLSYRWLKNNGPLSDGGEISGSLTSNLTLSAVSPGDAATYSVVVTNVAGTITSSNAVLAVYVLPSVTTQPVGQSLVVGSPAGFIVSATGTAPLGYQWLKNGVPLSDGGEISGSLTSNLTLSATVAGDAGSYSVVVTNVAGGTISSNAVLTVNAEVYVVPTNVVSGNTVSVPVRLTALGQEIAAKFSLAYNPLVLTYAGVDDPTVMVNTNSVGAGEVGLEFQNLGGYAPGDQKLVDVQFVANPVTSNTAVQVSFGDVPVGRQVIDGSFNVITNVVYVGGAVTVTPAEYAADVYPRPSGDHTVDLRDWAQEGRFVAGLDTVSNSDEMLRADCAPRGNPDGLLTVADWVQAGRYAAGLDPLTVVNASPSSSVRALVGSNNQQGGPASVIQVVNVSATNGQVAVVPVDLVAVGGENAVGFNVTFDPTQLAFKGAAKGSAAAAAQIYVNSNSMTAGRIGMTLALGAGQTFSVGTNQLALLSFSVLNTATGSVTVAFNANSPVVQQVVNSSAAVMNVSYVAGAVILPQPPVLQIGGGNGTVQLSWPQSYSNLLLESEGTNNGAWNTNLGSPSLSGSNWLITLPATNPLQYFRLGH